MGMTSDVKLPVGKACRDCRHFVRTCEWLISATGAETECDWSPSRFSPLPPLVRLEPDAARAADEACEGEDEGRTPPATGVDRSDVR